MTASRRRGIGLGVDRLQLWGWDRPTAFRLTLAGYLPACVLSCLWLNLTHWRHQRQAAAPAQGR